MPIVAVFDTTVLLSGLLRQGPPFYCLELARSGRVFRSRAPWSGMSLRDAVDPVKRPAAGMAHGNNRH